MKTWEQCCDYFGVNVDRGLSPSQVKSNLDKYGPNGKIIFGQKFKTKHNKKDF